MMGLGWRLILDGKRGAAENMAVDEAILRACAQGIVPPTIRIYSWQRPSISLGCLQSVTPEDLDLEYCRANGIEVVRRITGGRAVVHGSDVTFSIAIKEADLPEGCASVIASHRWLMGGIVAGLRLLGIDAQIGNRSVRPQRKWGLSQSVSGVDCPHFRDSMSDCFAYVAECDVRVGRAKAVGSAQVRRFGAILEQGSMPYASPGFDAARVFGRAARVADTCPLDRFSFAQIADAVARGLQDHLGTALEPAELTLIEIEMAGGLARGKYGADEWTMLRRKQPSEASAGARN